MAALPAAVLLRLVPAGSSLAAAIALTAVYSVLTMVAYGYVAVWRFAPYLDSAFGAGGARRPPPCAPVPPAAALLRPFRPPAHPRHRCPATHTAPSHPPTHPPVHPYAM